MTPNSRTDKSIAWSRFQDRIKAAKQLIKREAEESFAFREARDWPTMIKFDAIQERAAAQEKAINQDRGGLHIGTYVTLVKSARKSGALVSRDSYAITISSYYGLNHKFYVMQDRGDDIIIDDLPNDLLHEIEQHAR